MQYDVLKTLLPFEMLIVNLAALVMLTVSAY